MRITTQNKQKTRERIRLAARKLFQNKGFDETTTRHIAAEAHIATGTLFNYFPTKESLAMAIVSESLEQAEHEFHDRRNGSEALDELLFDQVAVSLRYLRPHRGYVGGVLDRTWSPLAAVPDSRDEPDPRVQHLETVRELVSASLAGTEPPLITLHLYWTLFLGVIAYWADDESPHQEDTLVLLDQSMKLFANSLSEAADGTEEGTNGTSRS